jgi:hypothetical protein
LVAIADSIDSLFQNRILASSPVGWTSVDHDLAGR